MPSVAAPASPSAVLTSIKASSTPSILPWAGGAAPLWAILNRTPYVPFPSSGTKRSRTSKADDDDDDTSLLKKAKLEASEETGSAAIPWYEGGVSSWEDDFDDDEDTSLSKKVKVEALKETDRAAIAGHAEDLWDEERSNSEDDSPTESDEVREDDDERELEETNWDGIKFEFKNLPRQGRRNWNHLRWASAGLLETLKKFGGEDVEEGAWKYAGRIAKDLHLQGFWATGWQCSP